MKSVLGMFKEKDEGSAVTHNNSFDDNEFQEFDDLDEDYLEDDDYLEEDDDSSDVFEEFTDKVQSLLDDGAEALEIAEEKTADLEDMDPNSPDYSRLVEEIKAAQAEARQNFDDAEFLIQKANEILEKNAK